MNYSEYETEGQEGKASETIQTYVLPLIFYILFG